ncbi:Protein translocase subunit SecD [Alphaproteobacteria bacterium SO-S41]|nr:Protein translocase subunit SecD [Alphaproteobacteria bacterium SO-S41]
MLSFSRWTIWSSIIACVVAFVIALPNVLPENVRNSLPGWFPKQTLSLGLDLQGGVYLLLSADMDLVFKEKLEGTRDEIRQTLRDADIGYTGLTLQGIDTVQVKIRDADKIAAAAAKLQPMIVSVEASLLGGGAKNYDLTQTPEGVFTFKMTEGAQVYYRTQTLAQSIEIVRRRIDELGTKEPTIQQQGGDRILVQVPGFGDPKRLLDLIGQTAKLTFRMVDESADLDAAIAGRVPAGSELLYEERAIPRDPNAPVDRVKPMIDQIGRLIGVVAAGDPDGSKAKPIRDQIAVLATGRDVQRVPIVIEKRVIVTGESLVNAQQSVDSQRGIPVVSFQFDAQGARRFGDATQANVGRRFAIVLDDKVISAPVINEPIITGSGQISGNFTFESANDLAILMRAGALPAKLTPEEARTVGAELGADSIQAGSTAAVAGIVFVVVLLVACYGLFGSFAVVGLTLNLIITIAIMTLLGATMTLPGIAGLILSIGMTVDANVLFYERIREERANGKAPVSSLTSGFSGSMSAIIDANVTQLLACLILFQLGAGPVRGFAVTLGIGIVVSQFTAVLLTRIMVVSWYRWRRPKVLPI